MGWGSEIGMLGFKIKWFFPMGCFGGCCFSRMSWTLSKWVWKAIWLLRCSGWPVLLSPICLSAALTFPSIMSLENFLVSWSVGELWPLYSLANWLWIVCPSSSKLAGFPSFQRFSRLSICFVCSLVFDLAWGFCSNRAGRIILTFNATPSSAELSA